MPYRHGLHDAPAPQLLTLKYSPALHGVGVVVVVVRVVAVAVVEVPVDVVVVAVAVDVVAGVAGPYSAH